MTHNDEMGQMISVSKILSSIDDHSCYSQDDDDDRNTCGEGKEMHETITIQNLIETQKTATFSSFIKDDKRLNRKDAFEIDDTWNNTSTENKPASPYYLLSRFGKKVSRAIVDKFIDYDQQSTIASNSTSSKVHNKYAVTPFKLPKINISRLEIAFQGSSSQLSDNALSRNVNGDSDMYTNCSDERDIGDKVKDDEVIGGGGENSIGRLTGGADKVGASSNYISDKIRTCSSYISDTDTLVGEENVCKFKCKL